MSLEQSYTMVGINYWPEPTGNAPYNSDLAEELAKNSNVTVVTGIPHYPWWEKQRGHSDLEYRRQHPGLTLVRRNHLVPKSQSNLLRAFMEISFGLSAILSGKIKGAKVILISPAMLSSAMILAWLRITRPKTRVLIWVQDLYEQGLRETTQKSGLLSRAITYVENRMLGSADQVVMAHPVFIEAKNLEQRESSKFLSIPNWSQFNFSPDQRVSLTRERYGLGVSKLVLHIGNMGVKQGLENVVEAARLAQSLKKDITFVLVGGGNQMDKLKELGSGVQNLFFIPPVSEIELANLMQAADVLLVNEKPGVKEMSIPSKLTTYYLSGKPVLVCSEIDSLAARSVLENKTGYWVQSGNPNDLLYKVESLELESSKTFAKSAMLYAEQNLGKNAALRKFAEILNKL